MQNRLEVKIKESNYENIHIDCPSCKKSIIYNRVSDLECIEPIGGREVECLNCHKALWISGDSVTPLYWDFIYQSEILFSNKRYMYCLLNICQAYEVFFLQYLKTVLVYDIFRGRNDESGFEEFKTTLNLLLQKVANSTFTPLRKMFMKLALKPPSLVNVEDTTRYINTINDISSFKEHFFDEYQFENKDQIVPYLKSIWESKVGEKRNDVVHKEAYRPSKNEVEVFIKEARKNIFNLEFALGVNGDFLASFLTTSYASRIH